MIQFDKFLTKDKLIHLVAGLKNLFVAKEAGKGLSTNDFTNEEKEKLAGIATGANKITVDEALSNSSTNPVQNKVINAALGTKANDADLAAVAKSGKYTDLINIPSEFNPAVHNHASNEVTAMTGYAKPSVTGAIGETDSLNTAIGKLEKALETKADVTGGTVDSAVKDGNGKNIAETYVAGVSASGTTVTVTKGDGSTATFETQDTTYDVVTSSSAGLMGTEMLEKLNGIEAGANKYVLPAATTDALGGVKSGANITNTNGTLSVTSANVVAALGYTPVTSTEVATAINNAGHLKYEVADAVPSVSEAKANTIYLVLEAADDEDNKYAEYMLVNGAMEKVGILDIDLSNYVQVSDIVEITNEEIDEILAS